MSADEEKIALLDREWNEAYQHRDVEALKRILADEWTAIDGVGLIISKQQLLERVASNPDAFDRLEFDEFSLRLFGDTAVVTGRLSISGSDNEDDGFSLRQRFTRVYVKRNSLWQAVAAQVTVMS
ncbi:MAG TPA: nuclear transport factor 2 family protein [Pyrinomonadaceae bacterium]|jgi:ketosteroid isomerase-like protein|nr:nuclear transport factor 2 family protein [Pyrinomonadaceae bacterium]